MKDDSDLATAFDDLWNTNFPVGSQIDRVSELHAMLAEYDGYVAGIGSSILKGKRHDAPPLDEEFLKDLEQALAEYPEASDELVQYIKLAKKLRETLRLAAATIATR